MNENALSELFEYLDTLHDRNRKDFQQYMEDRDYYKASEKLGANIQIREIRTKLMEIAYENRL